MRYQSVSPLSVSKIQAGYEVMGAISFLGIRKSGCLQADYSIIIDCEQLDPYQISHRLAFALGLVKSEDGKFSPAQLLDLIIRVEPNFEPKSVAMINFRYLADSELLFALELVSGLTSVVADYSVEGKGWLIDLFLEE